MRYPQEICRERYQSLSKKIFSKNFEKPLDKLARMWYNKYRKGKENPKHQKGKDYDKV